MAGGAFFSFVIFALYAGVGVYLSLKAGGRAGSHPEARAALGVTFVVVSLVYLFTGLQQVFHQLDRPLADRAFALFSMYAAFSATIPASYFASYLIHGDRRRARLLMIAYVALTCLSYGIVSGTRMQPLEYSWGSTWDFYSLPLRVYFIAAGGVPALAALAQFVALSLSPIEPRRIRRRIVLVTLSFVCIIAGWMVMPTGRELLVVASRALLLAGALLVMAAYYPPSLSLLREEGGKSRLSG